MARAKFQKVLSKSGKKGAKAPSANGERAVPIHRGQSKVAKMAQEKQAKVIDDLTTLAIKHHRTALKELERH